MGNHQSKPHQNRLSKPKTNTNSPSLPPNTDSPASLSSRYADLSAKGRQQIKDALLSPVNPEIEQASVPAQEEVARSVNRQTPGGPILVMSRNNSRTNSRSNSISCFGSRRGSMTKMGSVADSKTSPHPNTTVDIDAAIRLLQEVKKNASPEELAALHEVLESADGHAAPASEHNLSRNTSLVNRSSSSLTRRRSSVQTPGMATRVPPVECHRRTWNSWKTPQLQPEEEAKWNFAHKGPSPIARLSVVDSLEEHRGPPTARAQTPSDLDYGHLGGLRPGTLVVTNGAPSPAASTVFSDRTSRADMGEDYFLASEDYSGSLTMKATRRRGHEKSHSALLSTPTPLDDESRPPADETKESVEYAPPYASSLSQSIGSQRTTWPAGPLQINTVATDTSVQSATQYAQSYLAELPDSPFAPSKQNHGSLGVDMEHSQYHMDRITRTVQGAIYELDAGIETTGLNLSATTLEEPGPSSNKDRAAHRPSPQTYDSGYSSSGSLSATDRRGHGRALSDPSAQRRDLKSECPESYRKPMLRSILSRNLHSPDMEQTESSQSSPRPQSLMLLDNYARSSASDSTLSPQTPRSAMSKASFDSTSSKSKSRLQRRRPSQAEVPIVQSCQPIPEGTIPEVPDDVRAKFIRRLSNTPGMECLTNTYQSKDDVLAGNHVASDHFDEAHWPSQYAEQSSAAECQRVCPTPVEFQHLTEIEPERLSSSLAHGRRKSRSLFRRKSSAAEKESKNATLSIVDLGTIANSIGTSPYDAASTGTRRESVTSPTHPHQLGTSHPRAKSMVRMDSEAAAEFARMRSKDRMGVEPATPQPLQRPQQQRRWRSYDSSIDAGEAKAIKRRPQSLVGDIPPVPSIDRSVQDARQYTVISGRDHESQNMHKSELRFNAELGVRRHTMSQSIGGDSYQKQNKPEPTVDWDAHADTWRQRCMSIGEGLRGRRAPADARCPTVDGGIPSRSRSEVESWGRFSGGLGYDYEGRGVGVGGSAGTRQLNSYASTKSMKWRVEHGVDLSDVPIMVQRL